MIKKDSEKAKAIELRKQGKTYSQILSDVFVAKSTLSLWLRSVSLSKKQKQKITQKKLDAMLRGALAVKNKRLESSKAIYKKASKEISKLSEKEIFLVGIALYWAEGSKQKEHNVSQGVVFGNSDHRMIKLFLRWLELVKVSYSDTIFELYIHKTANIEKSLQFWSTVIDKPVSDLRKRVYYKKSNINSSRRNKGQDYHGLLRIKVSRSTDLNRKISGWIEGILKNCA